MAPLEIRTFPGAGGGTDLSSPVHMLPDSKARWIIDGLVDRAGLVRQRGKLKAAAQAHANSPYGLMSTFSPDGQFVLAAHISDDGTNNGFQFLDKNNGALGFFSYVANYDFVPPEFFWHSAALGAPGQVFSFSPGFAWEPRIRGCGYWRGGTKANYSTGTISATQGSAVITGTGTTWSTNLSPGMFMFWDRGSGNFTFLGVIKTVDSNTQVTLEDGSLFTTGATQAYKGTAIRQLRPRIGVGRISGASGQTIVNGTGTKFRQIGTGSTWAMFRARDMAFLGNVSAVASDTQLTLATNIPAGNEVNNDKYVAIKIQEADNIVNPIGMPGLISATWNNRQFYANAALSGGNLRNATLLWYSDTEDLEVLDTTKDGWFLEIPSSEAANMPIIGLCPTESGLLIFKETETYILSGSADTASWTVRKLTDNGCLAPMGIVQYLNGAIWPSDRGIFYYDGTTVKNLVADSLGDWWTKVFTSLQVGAQGYNMVGFHERDHYFLWANGAAVPTTASFYKGSTEQSFSGGIGFAINLSTDALTFLTNLAFRGATYASAVGTQKSTTRFLVEKGSDASSQICEAWTLFVDEGAEASTGGADDFTCASCAAGPNFYIESARYDMDDPQLKKLFKQVQIHYKSNGALTVDVVLNFDTTGTTLGSTFPTSSVFVNKRIKFLKRANLLGFRIYAIPAGGGTVPQRVELGPWAIGFKRQRPGRV